MTQVVEAARQGFVGEVTWADTWPGLLALAGLAVAAQPARAARHAHDDRAVSAERALRDRRADPAAELDRGRARPGSPTPTPAPAPATTLAVVLGLVLRAIVWRRFEPERARAGAREPARRRQRRRLHRPHDLLGPPGGPATPLDLQHQPRGAPSTPRRSSRRCWPGRGGSRSAIPPRSRGSPPSTAGSSANRDLDGDGLLWIVQPDESGLDSSPKFDPVWGRRAHARLGFTALIRRNRRRGWDARPDPRRRRAGALRGASSTCSGAWLGCAAGEPSITPALVERLWDERRGLFLDVARGESPARRDRPAGGDRRVGLDLVGAGAAGAARPARGDRPAPGRGAPARPRALLDPGRARPRSRPQEPSFEPRGLGDWLVRRYWRGPTWINSAWLIWLGPAPARLRGAGRSDGRGAGERRRAARAARVLRPARRRGPGRDATSAGQR